ncbi:MAG: alpha/beta hydrolase-fold protein [Terriglobia bacterium]
MKRWFLLLLLITLTAPLAADATAAQARPSSATRAAQNPFRPYSVVSPEVNADRTVTFRFLDPNAQRVVVTVEGSAHPLPMEKNADGVWTATTPALDPNFYGYSFHADGVPLIDPANSLIKPNLLNPQSMVLVPGTPPMPWEMSNVPHGVVRHVFYHSNVVGDNRDYYVYTPPGYDPKEKAKYPVLYLLHGYSDDASGWTAVGRANIILDNLLAQGKVKPMIVVMPLGYGAPEIVARTGPGLSRPNLWQENITKFQQALFTEVIPQVETNYRVKADRDDRAIAGLSMGGSESLYVGLNNLDRFAWVGSFSAAVFDTHFDVDYPQLNSSVNSKLHLLWIACGTEDRLVVGNRNFRAWLTSEGIHHADIETPGMHTWMVWRNDLVNFAPLLFQGAGGK